MIKKILASVAFILGLLLPAVALADVYITFNGGAAAIPGNPLVLSGSITNTGSSPVTLTASTSDSSLSPIGQVASGTPAGLSIDQTATAGYLPQSLDAGQTYQGPLVKINTTAAAVPGGYWGAYSVIGASGSNSTTTLSGQYYYFYMAITNPGNATTVASSTSSSTASSSSVTTVSNFVGLTMPTGLQSQQGAANGNTLMMPQYSNGPRLIKLDGSDTIYWVSANNLKLPMLNRKVFLSYKNKDADVQTVSQDEFNYYSDAKYIWLNGKGGIYKIDFGNAAKHLITSPVWSQLGLGPDQVINVNRTEFNSYKSAAKISDIADLQ